MSEQPEVGVKPAAKKPAAKKTVRKARAPKPVVDEKLAAAPKAKEKDRKSGWPIVWIDAVDGQPNYEVVGVNGEIYQIMREMEVPVPPPVLAVLRDAVAERIVQVHDPNGGVLTKRQKYSAVPWRLIGYVP